MTSHCSMFLYFDRNTENYYPPNNVYKNREECFAKEKLYWRNKNTVKINNKKILEIRRGNKNRFVAP